MTALLAAVRAPAAPRLPSVAVLTMSRDEGSMLCRWVEHYGNAVGRDNLLVLDDNSSDGSTAALDCPVIRVPELPGGHDFERARMRLVNGQARRLLRNHDFVIFVDVDEFLVPDPAKHAGLREFLAARRDVPVIAPMALNLVHRTRAECELDLNRPVLSQRSLAKFVPRMCKPSVKQVDAAWRLGGHGITRDFAVDPELFMLHLKFADQEHLRQTMAKRRALVAMDGRAPRSNWHRGREVLLIGKQVAKSADPASISEFDPAGAHLEDVVTQEGEVYCTRRQGQIAAMRTMPLVRVPSRLAEAL